MNSTCCISIWTITLFRFLPVNKRRSLQLCMAGLICRSTSPCSGHFARHRSFRFQIRSDGRSQANWIQTIYHGVPEKLLSPRPVKPAYLGVLGRIAPEKSIDRAIRVAKRCGIPLKIAAKVDRVDQEYYDEVIKPLLDSPFIEYIGEISDQEKSEFLSGAVALLVTIDWPEPFGLVMIEAMACGTPVVAFNRGSVPEIIEDDLTGLIVEDEISAVSAVGRISELDRQKVRARFEQRFTARRMAMDYLAAYRNVMHLETPRLKVVTSPE